MFNEPVTADLIYLQCLIEYFNTVDLNVYLAINEGSSNLYPNHV